MYSDLPAWDEHWVCVAGGDSGCLQTARAADLLLCGQRSVPNRIVIHLVLCPILFFFFFFSYPPFLSDYFLIEMEFPGLGWLGQVYVDEKALELLILLVTCPVLSWGGTPGLGV